MILTVAAFLSALGFGSWILGSIFEYPAVAFIGATIVVGVGALAMVDGLEHQAGKVEQTTDTNETTTTPTYEPVETPIANFEPGFLVLLLGGVMGLRSLDSIE